LRSSLASREAALNRRFQVVSVEVDVGGRPIRLVRPESSDALISEADYVRDERLPYWAELWPSALILARHVASLDGTGRSLLELGCGVGLVATAAARAKFAVTATDYYTDALLFTSFNVARNSGREPVVRELDWRSVPADLGRFDVVVASDVLYEKHYPSLIADVIARALAPGGTALIADPGRIAAPELPGECAARGLIEECRAPTAFDEGEIHQMIDIITIGWDAAAARRQGTRG
jgi:predicted nicotinamide N-methyase